MERKDRVITSEVQSISDQNRILRFITSNEEQDRDGDVIEVSGWQIDNYMKNPVVLFGHNYRDLPIGKTVSIEIDQANKRMLQDIKFATKDEYEFADTVYRLCKSGYLNTTSVGFRGLEHEPMFDENRNYIGRRYKKQELLETSIVPVPANPGALIEARGKGLIREEELKYFMNTKINDETKAGATLSAKTKKELGEICDIMEGCGGRLRKFLNEFQPFDSEDEDETDSAEKPKDFTPELKDILMEIKQVVSNLQVKTADAEITETEASSETNETEIETATNEAQTEVVAEDTTDNQNETTTDGEVETADEEIDLDAIEDPDEIDIDEEELDKALSHLIDSKINQITGGKSE